MLYICSVLLVASLVGAARSQDGPFIWFCILLAGAALDGLIETILIRFKKQAAGYGDEK